jgi:hypothetical protein
MRRFHQRLHDRLDLLAALRARQFLGRAVEARIVVRRHPERVGQEHHHVVDLADHARADLVDPVGSFDVGEVSVVDLLEIGFGRLAAARQGLVDDLVELRVIAGRVDVPDFVIAGDGGLAERSDLAKRDFREGHCAFVFVEHLDHGNVPIAGTARLPQ